jgi:hypothetical protein
MSHSGLVGVSFIVQEVRRALLSTADTGKKLAGKFHFFRNEVMTVKGSETN